MYGGRGLRLCCSCLDLFWVGKVIGHFLVVLVSYYTRVRESASWFLRVFELSVAHPFFGFFKRVCGLRHGMLFYSLTYLLTSQRCS